jgi:hypothetical protein
LAATTAAPSARAARLLVELSLLPIILVWMRRRSWSGPTALMVVGIAVAEYGRRADGGAARIPALGTLCTPVWMLERAVTAWMAVSLRLRRGVTYAGRRIGVAATPQRSLRRRLAHAGGRFDD